ncbi:MAG: hypothetical protein CI947_139 [Halanaerobium sp.]|nr:MAG: hypothetical protein CI947_139 [Halanaerobium sp.]
MNQSLLLLILFLLAALILLPSNLLNLAEKASLMSIGGDESINL